LTALFRTAFIVVSKAFQNVTYCGGTNQQWLPTPQSDGSYTFTARNSGNERLDVTNRSTANGTQLQQWACTAGDPVQTFRLVPQS
jgi:hypothetical protein